MDEPCSGGRHGRGRSPGAGRGAARRSAGALPRAGFPGRVGHGWVTGGRLRTGVPRWARVCAVTGLLGVVGLAAGAGTGTAQAADAPGAWSGYVSSAGPFHSVSADFIVPGAICSQGPGETGPWTIFWVGFQGGSGLVQTGFGAECVAGQPSYFGLHFGLTGAGTLISQPMRPGDQVDATVACLFGVCAEAVQDVTQNWNSSITLAVPPGSSGSIAGVAGESGDGGVTTGPVQVTNALMNGTPVGQLDPVADQQNLANYGGTAGLGPTPLDPTGTAFQFYWNGSTGS
jgi:hypothetical protein